jgi:hypothetical protein
VAAALAAGDGVDLVDDHGAHGGQHGAAAVRSQQHVQRLRRRHQDVRRALRMALRSAVVVSPVRTAVRMPCGGMPMAASWPPMPSSGALQVDADVVRQRLQGRDVQHLGFVRQRRRPRSRAPGVDRGQEGGQGLAGAGRRGDQRAPILLLSGATKT